MAVRVIRCARMEARLVELPEQGAPPGAKVEVLEASDGRKLRTARWEPGEAVARGTVLLLHGYTEFIEKYYEVVERLLARRFAVVTYDHRGQGLSERIMPERGHQTDFADLVADAALVHDAFAAGRGGPQLLLAHSMGGNVGLRLLQEEPGRFDRATLSAPMLAIDPLPGWLMRAVASAHVGLGLGESYAWGAGDHDPDAPQNRVTSDAARFERALSFWRAEPALVVSGVTWRWVREASRSMALVVRSDRMARIETPTWIASAGRDQVVSSRAHEEVEVLSPKVERTLLPDAMHEILQESDEIQHDFWTRFDAFVAE